MLCLLKRCDSAPVDEMISVGKIILVLSSMGLQKEKDKIKSCSFTFEVLSEEFTLRQL